MIGAISKCIGSVVVYTIVSSYALTTFCGNAYSYVLWVSPVLGLLLWIYLKRHHINRLHFIYLLPFLILFILLGISNPPWFYPRGEGVDVLGHFYIARMIYPSFLNPGSIAFTAYASGYHVLVDFVSIVLKLPLIQALFSCALFLNVCNGLLLLIILEQLTISSPLILLVIAICFPLSYYNIDALLYRGFYSQILGTFLLLFLILNALEYVRNHRMASVIVMSVTLLALLLSYPVWFPCAFMIHIFFILREKQKFHILAVGAFFLIIAVLILSCQLWVPYTHSLAWNIDRNGDCIHTALMSFTHSFFYPDALFKLSIAVTMLLGAAGCFLLIKDRKRMDLIWIFLFILLQALVFGLLYSLNIISAYYLNKMFYLLPIITYGATAYTIDKIKWGKGFQWAAVLLLLMPIAYISISSLKEGVLQRSVLSEADVSSLHFIDGLSDKGRVLYVTTSKIHAVWLSLLVFNPPCDKREYPDFESTYLRFYNHVNYVNLRNTSRILQILKSDDKRLTLYVEDWDRLKEIVRGQLQVENSLGNVRICKPKRGLQTVIVVR